MREFIKNMAEAEYKKHMEHYNAAANAFDKVMKMAALVDETKLDYQKKQYAICSDPAFTETYREKRVAELKKDALAALEAAWAVAEKAIPVFEAESAEIAETIILHDARLATAVSLATAAGAESMGAGAQRALVEPFAANLDALNLLHPVVKAKGLSEAAGLIDGYKATIEKANAFAEMAAQVIRAATLDVEGDYTQFALAAYAEAVATVYDFAMPNEIPDELNEAAVRAAMGLNIQ